MRLRMRKFRNHYLFLGTLVLALGLATVLGAKPGSNADSMTHRFIQIQASDKFQRSEIADLGIAIEGVRSDSVWAIASQEQIKALQKNGFQILGSFEVEVLEKNRTNDFPPEDRAYHNYQELTSELQSLANAHPEFVKVESIGKSTEGKDLWAIHLNTQKEALESGQSTRPGIVFVGNHHAREHLSVEVPLLLAKHLIDNRNHSEISRLIENRDIWIIPMLNPDGAEYDIASGNYKWWRKNRRRNSDGSYGVDLNRNYGHQWGTGGSSNDPSSDVYMGPEPFSEPETRALKSFVETHQNMKVLLSFHTFSELILYPWGYTYAQVADGSDHLAFEALAKTMARWNHYKPEQSSELYIASGDTTDWAYGEHGLFSFTFELSPSSVWQGGFYPGAQMIQKAFQDNLKPALYLIELADDPHRSINSKPSRWLENYVEPRIPESFLLDPSIEHLSEF